MSKARNKFSYATVALFAAASTPSMAQSIEQTVCETFIVSCDANGNGGVSEEEWEACGSGNGPDVFQTIDLNADGMIDCPEAIFFFLG